MISETQDACISFAIKCQSTASAPSQKNVSFLILLTRNLSRMMVPFAGMIVKAIELGVVLS